MTVLQNDTLYMFIQQSQVRGVWRPLFLAEKLVQLGTTKFCAAVAE